MESIEFERPVTLIVGHNGAGKTTIIECLKMATCGQLPPNCDKGHGFVHDPNVAGVPEVKGQIRLLFRTGVKHEHVCATRTFQLTNVRGKNGAIKSTFKALENLLRVKDKDGDNNSNSRRCADMDMMIPELMGVSRPILEHVIFCHQEDSNWPLGERIILKKRFDEIFGSSRYTKALETIDKKRKETAKEAKDKLHVLELITKDRELAVGLRVDCAKLEASSLEMESKIKQYSEDIVVAEKSLESLQKMESDNRSSVDKIRELTAQVEGLKMEGVDMEMCDGSIESLVDELNKLEKTKIEKSNLVSSLKTEFTSSLCSRNETSARLRILRKSVMEDSNVAGLIELKQNELGEMVKSAQEKFQVDDVERLWQEKRGERDLIMRRFQESISVIETTLQHHQDEKMRVHQKKILLQSQLSQLGEKRVKAEQDIARVDAELGTGRSRSDIEMEIIEQIRVVDEELEKIRANMCDSGQLGRAKTVLVEMLRGKGIEVSSSLSEDAFLASACDWLRKKISESLPSEEALWNAKSAGKIYVTLKQKSVQTTQCQFCKTKLSDISKFESNIDKHLEKLPGIISDLEKKTENLCFHKLLAQVELVQEFGKKISSPHTNEDLVQLEKCEREFNSQRNALVIKSQRLDMLFSEKEVAVSVISDSNTRMKEVQAELSEVSSKETELLATIDQSTVSKQQLVQQHNETVAGFDGILNSLGNTVHVIASIKTQLQQLKGRDTGRRDSIDSSQLIVLEQKETELNATTSRLMEELTGVESDLESITTRIFKLGSQIQFLRLSADLARIQSACVNCPPDIVAKISAGSADLLRLRELRSQLVGQSSQVKLQLQEIRSKLASHVDIDEKHRQALIQFETLNMVTKDVARYHQALDRALMQYHVTKMNEINYHLRELWERVYKGTDIDFIAIRSDTEEEGEVGAAKRSYNYRVVMAKNDVELEMRGRCSAGQKVLASLIIRLVLAESFSVNCGILALDEPTTNLDRANISGLAQALAELIESRRAEKNFQLVIITHDESFVRMLGRLHACDSYYRVTKDDGGHSTISRAAIYELNA